MGVGDSSRKASTTTPKDHRLFFIFIIGTRDESSSPPSGPSEVRTGIHFLHSIPKAAFKRGVTDQGEYTYVDERGK